MPAVSPVPIPGSAVPGPTDRVTHAARQFEAILLNTLLGSLEHSFCSLRGKDSDSGCEQYHSLGMQALATGLAARGGLGIADMIIRNLSKS